MSDNVTPTAPVSDTVVTEAVEESATTTETVEATVEDVIENYTLDDLLAYTTEDDPLFDEETNHTGMKPLSEWLPNVPEDVRKHIANMRRDYSRKTQELAAMRKEVEQAKRDMQMQNEGFVNGPVARMVESIDTETEYDLFDPEGMKNEIQRQAQLMLKEMLAPAQEEIAAQQRKMQLAQFKADNPELTDPEYRQPIIELLQARPELKLEDAFYIVKSKVGSTKLQKEREELAAKKARQRDVVRKSSGGARTTPSGKPQFKSAREAYEYHKARQHNKN